MKSLIQLERKNNMSEHVIDLEEFLERVQDDKELLLELLDIFMDDFQQKRKLLDTAISSNDFEEVKNISHSIKGASGNISAKSLRMLFLRLEDMGGNSDLSGAQDLLIDVDKSFDDLKKRCAELKTELGSDN